MAKRNDWLTRAQRVIRKHYGLAREVTQSEVNAELEMLRRRHFAGTLMDSQERLLSALAAADVVQV